MFVYAKNMQLAMKDKLRRSGMAAAAGLVMVIAAGFLLAALWTYFAHHLHWGPLGASLAIGGGLVVIAVILLLMARSERHATPTTDDLKDEVSQHLNLMANTAVTKATDAADLAARRASQVAGEFLDLAENKVHSVADNLTYRASRFADQTEARVQGAVGRFGLSNGAGGADGAPEAKSNLATLTPVLGAFAVGITLASRLQNWRHADDRDQDRDDEDNYL